MGKMSKKVMALVIAFAMIVGMSLTTFAADSTYKIKITANAQNDTHTYNAYQIIKGDLVDGQLRNLTWADGVNGAALLAALKADQTIGNKFTACNDTAPSVAAAMGEIANLSADAEALAAVLGAYVDSADLSVAGTTTTNEITGLSQGYYFVKDVTPDDALTYDTKSEYMLQVVGDVNVTAKDSTVSVEKKVDDKNDSNNSEDAISWQDSADYDIGDTVPYRLKGTLPSNYAKYDFFDYAFTDEMCEGLTLDVSTVKVVYYENAAALAADTTATGGTDITNQFTISPTNDTAGATLSVSIASTFDDDGKVLTKGLKAISGITANSVIVVYYDAVLNDDAEIGAVGNDNTAKLTYSNNPNATGEGDNTTSDTPEDKNIVFVYKVVVNKVDENNKPLAGAKFTLYKKVPAAVEGSTATGSELKEGFAEGVLATGLVDDANYVTIGELEAVEVKEGNSVVSYTANFEGVDDGDYVLVETLVPKGYNAWDAKSFTITATHDTNSGDPKLTDLSASGDLTMTSVSTAAGSMTADIQNQSGSTLPSTGGMGTTIFYVIGGILVLAAAIILISRRRVAQ